MAVRDLTGETSKKPLATARTLPNEGRWLPPALRSPRLHHSHELEAFGVTGCDPPHPRLTLDVTVTIPKVSRPIDTVPKQQLFLSTKHDYVRWDILSWDPPVEGMNKRDFSVNDVLFRKSKNRRYQVVLPRPSTHVGNTPRVHLPAVFSKFSSPSGRPKALDELVSWRRVHSSSKKDQASELSVQPEERLPFCDVSHGSVCTTEPSSEDISESAEDTPAKAEKQLLRSRTQPKLPPGSAVGFYRDLSSTAQQPNGSVNFIVSSELEDGHCVPPEEPGIAITPAAPSSSLPMLPANAKDAIIRDSVKDTESPKTATNAQLDSKSSEDLTERSLLTPASASFGPSWTKSPLNFTPKDSPARAPDPEHLKAVWSQAADKEPISAVNSLEGIADDLTALPFTIQDVKSEDGETPPPTSSAIPSKISIHDVTRAFQQVPASSGAPHRAPSMSPQTASGPITRSSTFAYSTSIQHHNLPMRPAYTAFPSPMLVHSPSPNLYPAASSPIPRVPVNGPSQAYNQHLWVPIQGSQNHNGAMRPMASPYPTQMIAYPAAGAMPPVYGPASTNQNTSTSTGGTVHPRGVPMMSPVMHPAAPANVSIYGGSPVMMHPPPIMPTAHRPPYMSSAAPSRGPVRSDGTTGSPLTQQPHPSNQHPQAVYSHVPYARPWC
ncbi:hypothetical protein EDC04DRAFT_192561 [Pisolithus marmoratus]|nr:hypothetical protein EDC04DRAFT_192561 [Pisolithus marmoratus]